jgi:DNA-binding CsgD family transcriptional regulator
MKTNQDLNITIPAAINALSELTLAEKVVLARIAQSPCCSNARFAELIGGTERGVEALLRRLRHQGHLESRGRGRAREHYLTFLVERHTDCGKEDITKSHVSCGESVKRELPLAEFVQQTIAIANQLLSDPYGCYSTQVESVYGRALDRVKAEMVEGPDKDHLMKVLTFNMNWIFALGYVRRNTPKRFHRRLDELLERASPEQLAGFRQRVDGGRLAYKSPKLLAACLASAIPA